jgi:multiple sugar transport system permease protein
MIRRNVKGLLFISPWLIGFLVFGLYPMIMAVVLAFTNYNILQPDKAKFTGLANMNTLVNDSLFWKSLSNTAYMTILGVPLAVGLAIVIALMLNQRVRGVSVYRTAIFLPTLVPPMVVTLLFMWILNPNYGLLKVPFDAIHVQSPGWLADPAYAKFAIMIMILWSTTGQTAVITLAGLKDIPAHLYEAASIDGAGPWAKFQYITLPGLSPIIFYNVLIGVIFFIQIFTQAFTATIGGSGGGGAGASLGGPVNSTLMMSIHIYKVAFYTSRAGYASMISLVILVISFLLALIFFRFARRFVHYEFSGN